MPASPHRLTSMGCFVCLDPLVLDVFHNCLGLYFPIQQLSTIWEFSNSQFMLVKQAEAGFKWTFAQVHQLCPFLDGGGFRQSIMP